MKWSLVLGVLVLVAGVLVGWYVFKGSPLTYMGSLAPRVTPTPAGSNLGAPEQLSGSEGMSLEKGGVSERTVVTYTDTGFAPRLVTVTKGTTVTFVNESSGAMWVASDPHPVHTLLSGFDAMTSVPAGGTYEYAFTKVGTWTYHNHMNSSMNGTVIVTE